MTEPPLLVAVPMTPEATVGVGVSRPHMAFQSRAGSGDWVGVLVAVGDGVGEFVRRGATSW